MAELKLTHCLARLLWHKCRFGFILRFFTTKINLCISLQIFMKHYFLSETTHDLHLRRMSFWKRNQASGRYPMSRMRLPYYVQEKNKEVDCFWCQIVKSKMCKRNKQKEYFLPIAKDYGFVNLLVEAKVGSILVLHTNKINCSLAYSELTLFKPASCSKLMPFKATFTSF